MDASQDVTTTPRRSARSARSCRIEHSGPPRRAAWLDRFAWLTRFADSTRVEHVLVTSAGVAALSLVDPARRGVGGRVALRAASAALTGFVTWAALRDTPPGISRGGLTAVSVGAGLALSEAGDAIDARMHRFVVQRGARHPRLVIAAAAGAAMLLTQVAGARVDAAGRRDVDAAGRMDAGAAGRADAAVGANLVGDLSPDNL